MSKLTVTAGLFAGVVIGATSGYLGAANNDIQKARQDLAEVQEQAREALPPGWDESGKPPVDGPPKEGAINDGTWRIGPDIAPGTYRTENAGTSCYWQRQSGTSGEFGEIITNGLGNGGPIIVTIEPTDIAFKTERCGTWMKTS